MVAFRNIGNEGRVSAIWSGRRGLAHFSLNISFAFPPRQDSHFISIQGRSLINLPRIPFFYWQQAGQLADTRRIGATKLQLFSPKPMAVLSCKHWTPGVASRKLCKHFSEHRPSPELWHLLRLNNIQYIQIFSFFW